MLVPKAFLRLGRVGRYAEDRGLIFSEGLRQAREVDGLLGAAGGVRARIEKQHQLFPGEVGERDGAAAIARQAEGGRFRALGQYRFKAGGRGGFPA